MSDNSRIRQRLVYRESTLKTFSEQIMCNQFKKILNSFVAPRYIQYTGIGILIKSESMEHIHLIY